MNKKKIGFRKYLDLNKMSVEGFVIEARKRNIKAFVSTATGWSRGSIPREATLDSLEAGFPGIRKYFR